MSKVREIFRHWGTQLALVAVIFALAATGIFRETTRSGEPEFTAENVARFYAGGETGLVINIDAKEDVSVEVGAEEAYRFTISAEGFEGSAQIVVAKTDAGGWVIVPQQVEGS